MQASDACVLAGDACRDGDHKLTKGDVLAGIGPLMHVAQAGIVFMGSSEGHPRQAASVWEEFRDSMRELATDKVAAAIATGAFDEADADRTGRLQGVHHMCPECQTTMLPHTPVCPWLCVVRQRSAYRVCQTVHAPDLT